MSLKKQQLNIAIISLWLATSTYAAGNIDCKNDSLEKIRESADEGLSKAQACLGELLFDGDRVERNEKEGIKWLESAAANESDIAESISIYWMTGAIIADRYTTTHDKAYKAQSLAFANKALAMLSQAGDEINKDTKIRYQVGIERLMLGVQFQFDESYTANNLIEAYDVNAVAADMKFKDIIFKLEGIISSIQTNVMNQPYVTLRSKDQLIEPQLHFGDEPISEIAALKKGQEAEFVCTGAGDVMQIPMLSNCRILHVWK